MSYDLSIIIPCYNEKDNLPLLLEKIKDMLFINKKMSIEVILVNNGSIDITQKQFDEITYSHDISNNIKTLHIPTNKGAGYGILYGLDHGQADILAYTHADLQTDINDIITAYNIFKEKNTNCIIKGKRIGRTIVDKIFATFHTLTSLIILKILLKDIGSQPNLFSKTFYNSFLNNKPIYKAELETFILYMAKSNNIEIYTFPVKLLKRQFGEAKGSGTLKSKIKLSLLLLKKIYQIRQLKI